MLPTFLRHALLAANFVDKAIKGCHALSVWSISHSTGFCLVEDLSLQSLAQARELNGGPVYVAEGYNSDEEVYATDKAMQQGQANAEEDEVHAKQQIGPLAPLDHDNIAYEPFAKDFYAPAARVAALTPAQVICMHIQAQILIK